MLGPRKWPSGLETGSEEGPRQGTVWGGRLSCGRASFCFGAAWLTRGWGHIRSLGERWVGTGTGSKNDFHLRPGCGLRLGSSDLDFVSISRQHAGGEGAFLPALLDARTLREMMVCSALKKECHGVKPCWSFHTQSK